MNAVLCGLWVLLTTAACSLRLGCSRGEIKSSKHVHKAMLHSLALAAVDADIGKATDQGADGPLAMLNAIVRACVEKLGPETLGSLPFIASFECVH